MSIQLHEYVSITKYTESNIKNYGSLQINRNTICPTFGVIYVKQITWYFLHTRIMWAVNILDSIGVDVGEKLVF